MMMQVTVRSALAMRTARSIRWRTCAGVGRHVDVFAGDVLEQRDQIDFLLIMAAQRDARLLPDNGHHRLMIHLRIVKPVQQMDGAGPGGGEADPEFAGELGVARRP